MQSKVYAFNWIRALFFKGQSRPPSLDCVALLCWHFITFSVERFQADSNLIFRWFLIGDNSARSDWNLPERDALTPPGESLVTILCICAGFHVLVLTSYFLAAVTILSLERNKKLLTSLSAKRHNAITCWSEGSKFTQ